MTRLTRANAVVKARDNKYIPQLNVYGNPESGLRHWRAALQRCRSGTGDARILGVGDSIANGAGATTALTQNFMALAASVTAARTGLTARKQVIDRAFGTVVPTEVTLGTGWAVSSQTLLPMYGWLGTGATAGTLDITPTVPVDSFIIYSFKGGSSGNYQYAVDGAGLATHTNGGGSAGIEALTVSAGTLGTHTLHINAPASNNAYIMAIEAVNSTSTSIKWWCSGNSGFTTNSYLAELGSATSSSSQGIQALASDLVVIELGVNDYTGAAGYQFSPAVMQANLTAFVRVVQGYTRPASVLLLGWPPNGVALSTITGYTYPQSAYYAALDAVVDATGCLALHLDQRWGAYPASNVSPITMYSDATHPNTAGHADIGTAIANLLVAGG